MADTIATTNMNLTLPIVGTRTGTAYASDINTALIALDAHDHSSLNGVKITPAGLDITADLDVQGNNIDNARAMRLTDQLANISGANDTSAIYSKDGDLWYNNEVGSQIQLTNGGSLNTGALVTNVWGTRPISANLTIIGSDTYSDVLVSSSSAITITLPAANAVSAGRYYVIQDVTGTSQTYAITLTPVSSATINGSSSSKTLSSQYGTWIVVSDGTSKWMLSYSGHSGLTASSLIYGSTVLNSSGLTAASVTTSANVSVGGTLSVTGATTLAATTLGGALTGTSGHFTSNLVVDGNLTVTGTVSFDAGSLAISNITGGTIVSCTITGGTMTSTSLSSVLISGATISSSTFSGGTITSPTISNGSISGATITGGSVGSASGIATLDGSAQLKASQRVGWMVDAKSASIASNYGSSGATWNNVTGMNLSVTVNAGDKLIIDVEFIINALAGASVSGKVLVYDGSGYYDPYQYVFASCASTAFGSDTKHLSRSFVWTALNTGTLTVSGFTRSPSTNAYTVLGLNNTIEPCGSSIRIVQYRP